MPADHHRGWQPARLHLDPLAVLLRERFTNRAHLAAATGLSYQTLRTCTDGVWTRQRRPSAYVLAMLGTALEPDELDDAVQRSLLSRTVPPLTFGQRVVLEALRGFDDTTLTSAAPHIHELLRDRTWTSQH